MGNTNLEFHEEFRCDGILTNGSVKIQTTNFFVYKRKYHYKAEITFSLRLSHDEFILNRKLLDVSSIAFEGRLFNGDILTADGFYRCYENGVLEGGNKELNGWQ